jgi:hypothetical protein
MTDLAETIEICDTGGAEMIAHQQACAAEGKPVQISHEIAVTTSLDQIEAMMLAEPQIDCPVQHHFGGGVYIREGAILAGTYSIGHSHKKAHMNMLTKGKIAIASDGDVRVIDAPYLFVSKGGRKLFYVIEDAVLMNIFATNETNIDVIEETFVDKSDAWRDAQQTAINMSAINDAVKNSLWRDK